MTPIHFDGPWYGLSLVDPTRHRPVDQGGGDTTHRKSLVMTLLAVTATKAKVVVAADGRAVYAEPGKAANSVRFIKFRRVGNLNLVIGAYGATDKFEGLVQWMQSQSPSEWLTLIQDVREQVNLTNRASRFEMHASGRPVSDSDQFLTVIIAEFVGTEAGYFVVTEQGRTGIGDDQTEFFGLHDNIARGSLAVGASTGGVSVLDTAEHAHTFMSAFCDAFPEILKPVDVWEITATTFRKTH